MDKTDTVPRWWLWVAVGILSTVALPVVADEDATPELDVPYVPTHRRAVNAMLKLAKVTSQDHVMDLGCGDGRIVVAAASKYKARGTGVDLDPQRIRESNQNAKKTGVTDRVTFRVADIMDTDVREATVVTLFLLESVNVQLRPKLFAELKPGVRVVSNTFHMRDWKPDKVRPHRKAYDKVLYLWVMPAPVGGTWDWRTKLSGKEIPGGLRLEQEFQAVRGELSFPDAGKVPIANASLVGKELSFTATVRMGQKRVVVAYRGRADGDILRGTQQWRGGPHEGPHPWVAKRSPVDLVGRWQVRSLSRADCNGTLHIERKGTALSATYVLDSSPKKVPLPGFYVWGPCIRFEVPKGEQQVAFSGYLGPEGGGGLVGPEQSKSRTTWSGKRLAPRAAPPSAASVQRSAQ